MQAWIMTYFSMEKDNTNSKKQLIKDCLKIVKNNILYVVYCCILYDVSNLCGNKYIYIVYTMPF